MRHPISLLFALFFFNCSGQKTIHKYLELRANIDAAGNLYINEVVKPIRMNKSDSLVDYKQLRSIVKLMDPIKIMNRLAEDGWFLVTTTHLSSDKENRPNSPFIVYYFKKKFVLNE